MPKFVFDPVTDSEVPSLGGKARTLLELKRAGDFKIPLWFAVLPDAAKKNHRISRAGASALEKALADHPVGATFAVRSSALEEDGSEHSFAGQLESFLHIPRIHVATMIERVWESGFSPRVQAYCKERGLPRPESPPVVLVQQMLDPDAAGVAFSADPVHGRRTVAVISGLWGMGTGVVSAGLDADTWTVNREGKILERKLAIKTVGYTLDGITPFLVPLKQVHQPCLSDEKILAVAALVRSVAKIYATPQDIEWAYVGDDLHLLQARPITSLNNLADPDGGLSIWDNSNIAESYNGFSSPLTFSFARRVYEEVYRQFCRILSVPEKRIEENADTFRRMLGYLRGRIYYNLVSWYRVLALLPGFQVNRRFMEQMMGVKEGLPDEILAELTPRNKWADSWNFLGSLTSLLWEYFTIEKNIRNFQRRLDRALTPPSPALDLLRLDELVAHYRALEAQLLTKWDAPLVNDFFAMIFHGLLRKLGTQWCGDPAGTLGNDLISGQGGVISAEPAVRLEEMARVAASDLSWVETLCQGTLEEIHLELTNQPVFEKQYHLYLEKFAGRCLEELKLETETLDDDPLLLFRSIGSIAAHPPKKKQAGEALHVVAEKKVSQALGGRFFRKIIFRWVLRNARKRVVSRENLRFERTRVFGRVRKIFQEIGRRLAACQLLVEPRDIFWLTVEEVVGFVDGTTVTTDLVALVELRKAGMNYYHHLPKPGDRFNTRGAVHDGNHFASDAAPFYPDDGNVIVGQGCSPGKVRGRVRLILDPRQARIEPGEILVAPRTDPGWVLLFPSAAGLLVEYGSLLSHSAIVSRELGLPSIISIAGLTDWLETGDWIEMDGSTGVVQKIPQP